MFGRIISLSVGLALVAPAAASADYTSQIDTTTKTVTLTGSGPVTITTSGGVLSHNAFGFGSAVDFDSTQSGDQTVPDTGGWEIDVTGGGQDSLEVDEGEAAPMTTFASGHTFTPGGKPCIVRDPNQRNGIDFTEHRAQETWFCYPSGIDNVTVHAGMGATEFDVLDTQDGVPLHFFGGAGQTQVSEAANVPTSVGGFHEPMSPVSFTAGSGPATVALNDGDATAPATYNIGSGSIVKSGLQPLNFSGLQASSGLIQLYPQQGPSTIDIGPTGGVPVEIFGEFFSQPGPDQIDGSKADAPLSIAGSLGNDTIIGGPEPDYIDGGDGNDTITTTGGGRDQVICKEGTDSVANVDSSDSVTGCKTVHISSGSPTPSLKGLRFKRTRVRHDKELGLVLPPGITGTITLTFKRLSCRHGGKCHHYVAAGTTTVNFRPGTKTTVVSPRPKLHGKRRVLPKGTYKVTATLNSGGKTSKPVTLSLVVK